MLNKNLKYIILIIIYHIYHLYFILILKVQLVYPLMALVILRVSVLQIVKNNIEIIKKYFFPIHGVFYESFTQLIDLKIMG